MARSNKLINMKDQTSLILVANPGSASRKYALFRGDREIASLHFETLDNKIICTVTSGDEKLEEPVAANDLESVLGYVETMLVRANALTEKDHILAVGLRIVAPSGFFLGNYKLDDEVVGKLKDLERVAPLHIGIVLKEYDLLSKYFPGVPVYGISDSGFHSTKPDYAWNYAIPLQDADTYEIKRYGYHGLSVQSVVRHLERHERLANKMVVAHLGSGASITALHGGKSMDNTMGYSPLEGLVMSTRSGVIDYSAVRAIQIQKGFSDAEMETYLNESSGLLGLGGSDDIRVLLSREEAEDYRARLALNTYIYNVQKGIAQMTAALGGIDALVFTGTVGERSSTIRHRIVERLHYLDIVLDSRGNSACIEPLGIGIVSKLAHSKPVYVVHADEAAEISRQVLTMLK